MNNTLILIVIFFCTANSEAAEFRSPQRKFNIIFQEATHKKLTKEKIESVDDVSNVEYKITFKAAQNESKVVSARYTDVYGFRAENPTPLEQIFKKFIWSPKEDFVLLPPENWARAPGTDVRLAVALNPKHSWSAVAFKIDIFRWIDDERFIGDRQSDCSYGVYAFNGKSGMEVPVKSAASPIGYRLTKSIKDAIVLENLLDNCSGAEEKSESEINFKPSCFLVEPKTLKASPTLCR